MLNVRAHTCYLGKTGFSAHARGFFRELSKYVNLKVRNFTWDDSPDYLNDVDRSILNVISLRNNEGSHSDYPISHVLPNQKWTSGEALSPDVDIVLMDLHHFYFYENYSAPIKIAYTVWESTQLPEEFFNRLLNHFDYLWVVTQWHKDIAVKQGYPAERVFVVNEGVDPEFFVDESKWRVDETLKKEAVELSSNLEDLQSPFSFLFFGRWDYRKAVPEILQAFVDTFEPHENVELILSADNPYSVDGLKSTEDRLAHYDITDPRIKVVHFVKREEYLDYIKNGKVLVTCARSEGWNIPLIEALAAGTPAIYSDWGAQLEFAAGKGLPVKIANELPASIGAKLGFAGDTPGLYAEPDFADLGKVMRDAYENYSTHKEKAVRESFDIAKRFNWEMVTLDAVEHLLQYRQESNSSNRVKLSDKESIVKINYHFLKCAQVEVLCEDYGEFLVEFIDLKTGEIKHSAVIRNNMWTKTSIQYYVDWKIVVKNNLNREVIFEKVIDLTDKRVYVSLDSSSLGDTLSWFPAVDEFRKKHNCKMVCSTFLNHLLKDQYPEIEFVDPGTQVNGLEAMYSIGWYYDSANKIMDTANPVDPKGQPMQKAAFDILGLDYEEVVAKINVPTVKKRKQVSIAIHGTCQAKYWNNPTGWQEVVDWCNGAGYEVVLLSREEDGFMGNQHPTCIRQVPHGPLHKVVEELVASHAFIGIGSGLSWLSWAAGTPTILISGFSEGYTETVTNTTRVCATEGKCSGCFNTHRLDAGDWNWCPLHKSTHRMFECTRSIKSQEVIQKLKEALGLI